MRACLCLHISVSVSFFLIGLRFVSLFSVDTHTKLSISAFSRQGELHFLLYCPRKKPLLAVSFTHTGPLLKMPWWEKALWLKMQPSSFCHRRRRNLQRTRPDKSFLDLEKRLLTSIVTSAWTTGAASINLTQGLCIPFSVFNFCRIIIFKTYFSMSAFARNHIYII